MTRSIPIEHTLSLLQRLNPPDAIIHAGSGTGIGPMHCWRNWDVPRALLLDAAYGDHKPACFSPDSAPPGWSSEAALLSNSNGHACMYHASNPAESGLLQPEALNIIWPNLVTKDMEQRPAIRLDTLLAEPRHAELRSANNIWCVVDCLPALPILQGAGEELQNWSVLWLRVLLKPSDGELKQATLPACRELIEPLGYRCLHVGESNHPALGDAIFVRDWAVWLHPKLRLQEKRAEETDRELEELSGAKEKLVRQFEEIKAARDEQARLAAARQISVNQLQQEKENLSSLAAERQSQVEQLTAARDEQARLADERQISINQLQQEKENLSSLAAERQSQVEQLTAARDEQARLADELQTEISRLKTELQEAENRKNQLESQLAELEHRQQLMNEEMVKAEGQIELIKDLLLREPGL